jgi:hypothetical protein
LFYSVSRSDQRKALLQPGAEWWPTDAGFQDPHLIGAGDGDDAMSVVADLAARRIRAEVSPAEVDRYSLQGGIVRYSHGDADGRRRTEPSLPTRRSCRALWAPSCAAGAAVSDQVCDSCCNLGDGFVLPRPDYGPSSFGEAAVGVPVAFPVAGDLGWPVPAVGGRVGVAVLSAPVPEAAVYEHGDLDGAEDDVGAPP